MKNWERVLVKRDDTILTTLEILNKQGTQFVAVVDDQLHLLGVVTDGDIRRGLLKGITIQDSLGKIMNSNPNFLQEGTAKEKIKVFMADKNLQHLPIVDSNKKILNIISQSDLLEVEKKENHIVLMAGGLGSRLASLTNDCPKPMLKVGNKPILETIIEIFKEHGFYKFIIAVNYKSEVIEEYFKDGSELGVEISYLKEEMRLGTAGALSLYSTASQLPFIVMNADLLTKIDFSELVDFHLKKENSITMCLRHYEHQIPFGVVVTEQDRVLKIEEKPISQYFVNGGIYVLNPEVLKHIPKNIYYDMPTFIESIIQLNLKVGAFPFNEYWIDIGRLDDYERAHAEFLEVFK